MPSRVDFLCDMYGIPKEKVGLLVMGADDEYVKKSSSSSQISEMKRLLGIKKEDFIIVTGGKIDSSKKQILLLMEAVASLKKENLKLIVFGSISEEIKKQANKWIDDDRINYVGWIDAEKSYNYFAIADLVVFPGRHSVFWEQVAGQGKPMLVKDWPGTHHVDLGGNVIFIKNDSMVEVRNIIDNLINDRLNFNIMKNKAHQAMTYFSYAEISKRSIEDI
jgi:glycosyltransferase involved in cell wall biosynthesis